MLRWKGVLAVNVMLHFDVLLELRASLGSWKPQNDHLETTKWGPGRVGTWLSAAGSAGAPHSPPPVIQQVERCRCRVPPQGVSAPTRAVRDFTSWQLSEGQAGIRREKVTRGWPRGCGPDPISQPVRTATEQGAGIGPGFQALGDTWAGWRGPESGPESRPQQARAAPPAAGRGPRCIGPGASACPLLPDGDTAGPEPEAQHGSGGHSVPLL